VNVAQPSPYSPGSLVSTFTTTSRIPSGAVWIARTAVIRTGGSAVDGPHAGGTTGSGHAVSPCSFAIDPLNPASSSKSTLAIVPSSAPRHDLPPWWAAE